MAIDIKAKEVVSVEVSNGERLKSLVRKAMERVKVKRVLGNGAMVVVRTFFSSCEGEGKVKVKNITAYKVEDPPK